MIFCAHLRQTTKDENYQKEGKTSGPPESAEIKPTEEVQSLLNILFKPDKDKFIFDGLIADLEGVYLQGANLQKAKLIDAKMQGANLQRANLQKAKLIDAKLIDAKMQHAFLIVANLQKARLWNTKLQNANLQGTDLQYADLKGPGVGMEADIEGVDMSGAKIYHALMPEGWEEKVKENDVITQKWP
ncbi:MAG: pentapeptide repeat-containing protein [Gammaproteobacteria bacterium WSBS_2016_MAG_OTU1]